MRIAILKFPTEFERLSQYSLARNTWHGDRGQWLEAKTADFNPRGALVALG
jgi:hypothetical protein